MDETRGCPQCIALSAMLLLSKMSANEGANVSVAGARLVVEALGRIARGSVPCPQHPTFGRVQAYRCLLCMPQTVHADWPAFEAHQNEHHRGPLDQLMVVNETGYPLEVTAALMGNVLQVMAKPKPKADLEGL